MYRGLCGYDALIGNCTNMVTALIKDTPLARWAATVEIHDLSGDADNPYAQVEWSWPGERMLIKVSPKAADCAMWTLAEIISHEVAHAVMNLRDKPTEEGVEEAADAVGLALLSKAHSKGLTNGTK